MQAAEKLTFLESLPVYWTDCFVSLYQQRYKEANPMKTVTLSKTDSLPVIPFPNALTRQQVLHKVLDTLLIAASGIGITAALAFLLTLG